MKTITCKPVIESNRISLTKEVRDILQVEKGDFIQFVQSDDKIILAKVGPTKRSD